ncbi:MAG: aminotransferase class I/II-fold pyridoxal phosphate-dependent enzyme [Clostridiaceae bacterium]|nr:aminotransferase class I/II-fold pyridoxal phosphate-dependent enzyme [Clostridiaceae bacterium]
MNIPLFRMLETYKKHNPLPFHMPGHIHGRGLIEDLKIAGSWDITEIPGSDCLHNPSGVIKEAQLLAAKCFGAEYSIFLVNGSTSGIHIMINSVVKQGGKLIIGRDCHRSVLNALALLNAEPVFVLPQIDKENNIPLGVTSYDIEQALKDHPDAQGILITRPNYYGIATSIKDIVQVAEKYNVPLLVDEAHGAHFNFHGALPESSVTLGAELCVQSLHKTLPALTQTALLHGKNNMVDKKKVEMFSAMLQTTSPSYLLMASIDIARDFMEREGYDCYQRLWQNINDFNTKLNNIGIKRVTVLHREFETDFSRITLSFKNTSLSGYQAEEILRKDYGIVVEMAELFNLVLIATPFHTKEDFKKLLNALERIYEKYGTQDTSKNLPLYNSLPERTLPLHQAIYHKTKEVPINKAAGEVSSASVVPYPPGVPLLNPGEKITFEIIEYIMELLASGCIVHGINENKIPVVI